MRRTHSKNRGNQMNKWAVVLLTAVTSANAWAAAADGGADRFKDRPVDNDDIYLGIPSYGGTGCPAGTASVTLSPDAKALSILFDTYVAEVGGTSGKTLDRKSCNVAVPVH